MLKWKWLLLSSLLSVFACQRTADFTDNPIPATSNQMIVVVNESFETPAAVLYRFQRQNSKGEWAQVSGPVTAIVGKKGLGWGRGLHSMNGVDGPVKKEGDGKSPAGVFHLDYVFGFFPPEEMKEVDMPYQHVRELVECVDDPTSDHYNTIVYREAVDRIDWNSSERMWRARLWYELGVFVAHNTNPAITGAGSCIFLHYWVNPQDSTSGCTAMKPADLKDIVYWLEEEKLPVLVQLPHNIYEKVRHFWALPDLNTMDKAATTGTADFMDSTDPNDDTPPRNTPDFRAVGNEPGWILTLSHGGEIHLQTQYGRNTYRFKTPEPEIVEDGRQTIYRLEEEDFRLIIIIEDVECQDTMSGKRMDIRVTVRLNDDQWTGCGEYL